MEAMETGVERYGVFHSIDRLQTCHFDLTKKNLNECEKKSEYTEKNLNLSTKIGLLYRNL